MRRFRLLLICLLLWALAWFGRAIILSSLGHQLILEESPFKADAIVVLAGDVSGERVMKAVELYQAAWAPKIFVSSAGSFFDVTEGQLATQYAVNRGLPATAIEVLQSDADSTIEESKFLSAELSRRGVKSYLLVSSDYHTRRAAKVVRRNAPGFQMHVLGSKTAKFDPDTWWQNRPARKIWLMEAAKTVADWMRL